MCSKPWTQRVVTAPAAPALPEPLTPTRPRSNEPKPFEGLTQKPHCALCEQDPAYPLAPPPVPPDPVPPTNRRPLLFGDPWHALPRQTGNGGADRTGLGLPG